MPAQKNGIRRLSAVGFGGRAGFLQDLVPDENAQRVGAGIAIDLQTDDDIRIAKKRRAIRCHEARLIDRRNSIARRPSREDFLVRIGGVRQIETIRS